jgi:protein-disulfide isomerase
LLNPAGVQDRPVGAKDAKVIVIEYSSPTCPHCAAFAVDVYPEFKTKYIDTGKVYFVLREFPLDELAFAAVMAARCAPKDKFFPIIDTLFREQNDWAFVYDPQPALVAKLQPYGFTEQSFAACLQKPDLAQAINDVAMRAQKEFGVSGTPAFFINGEKYPGEMNLAALESVLTPLLAKP